MSSQVFSLPPLATFNEASSGGQSHEYTFNSKVMVAAMLILLIVVLFVISLHVYAKWFWRQASTPFPLSNAPDARWRRRGLSLTANSASVDDMLVPTTCVGLESTTISSLPTFIYQASKHDDGTQPLLECAVCLSEFQPYEKCRILPNCQHSFHIGCIDMWFHSHSTCPLCRAPVSPWTPQLHDGQNTQSQSDSPSPFTQTTPHQYNEHTTSHSPLQSCTISTTTNCPLEQSTSITPLPPGHPGMQVFGQHQEGIANIDEPLHRYGTHIAPNDGACGSSSTRSMSVEIQGNGASIARCQSLGIPRCQSEDNEAYCSLRPVKSGSFRMSIKWLLSRDLSRGRGRVFPSAVGGAGAEQAQFEQSSPRSSLPL